MKKVYYLPYSQDYLAHHGIKGQRWGVRRWQNSDGSLTPAGREHYGYGAARNNPHREKKIGFLNFRKRNDPRTKQNKAATSARVMAKATNEALKTNTVKKAEEKVVAAYKESSGKKDTIIDAESSYKIELADAIYKRLQEMPNDDVYSLVSDDAYSMSDADIDIRNAAYMAALDAFEKLRNTYL